MNPAVLGAIAGFFGAFVPLAVPLLVYLNRVDNRSQRAVRLLTGEDDVEGDGVIPRLRRAEERVDAHRQILEEELAEDVAEILDEVRGGSDG